jgi:hypothetical protein
MDTSLKKNGAGRWNVCGPDVQVRRRKFLSRVRSIPTHKLVFIDESGMNLAMSRSHAWVKRGHEFIERVPMNWGKNLTVLGAIRLSGWVALTTMFATANKQRFVRWLRSVLLPKLGRNDVLVMDNLAAHHDPRVTSACAEHGVELLYLPPYSPDLNQDGPSKTIRPPPCPASPRWRSDESPDGLVFASLPDIVADGSSMLAIRFNSGDLSG